MQEHEKTWRPLAPGEIHNIFSDVSFPWWIGGGIALELSLGREIRSHGDIDVGILRRDHLGVRAFLSDWDCWAADPPGTLRPWPVGEILDDPVHDIWVRRASHNAWCFQLMVDETDGDDWVSRRDNRIRLPLPAITHTSDSGIPYLKPHVQLYYKAKNPRNKDQIDFNALMESNAELDLAWLRAAITCSYGATHPWLERLS